MSAGVNFHGPYEFESHYYAPDTVEDHPAPYSSLNISDGQDNYVTFYFASRADVDALSKAAATARDEWPEPEPASPVNGGAS
jgi:hypothetical protein